MDFFRRLHQSSYPPRPSPLGSAQESREDRPRNYPATAANEPRGRPEDKPRPTNRYDYQSPTSSAHIYPGASRSAHPIRGESSSAHASPTRNTQTHQHRRHASLENRQHPHVHRRNASQPHSRHVREGRHDSVFFILILCVIFWEFMIVCPFLPKGRSPLHMCLQCPGFRKLGLGVVPWFRFGLRTSAVPWG